MTKTDPRHRNPAYDPLEETQENPALPPQYRPGRRRWPWLLLALGVVLLILAWVFFS